MNKNICLHKYMIKKSIINFWIVNAVINGVIFVIQTNDKTKLFTHLDIMADYILSIFILGMLCSLTGFPMIKKDIQKGLAPAIGYNKEDHIIAKYFPKNVLIKAIMLTIMTMILIIPFFIGIPAMFGMPTLNYMQALVLKIIATGFAGVIVGYFVMVLTLTEHKFTLETNKVV